MKKIFRTFFSRRFLAILFILIQITGMIVFTVFVDELFFAHFIVEALSIILSIRVISSRREESYKVAWVFFLLLFPYTAILFYVFMGYTRFTKKEKRFRKQQFRALDYANTLYVGNRALLTDERDLDALNISKYIHTFSNNPLFKNTEVTYYGWGEEVFPVMKEKLKKAKHFIFLEYFIIAEGEMWNEMFEILKEKAMEGLDVRIIFDDFGCVSTLPGNFDKICEKHNIKCYVFGKLRPLFNIRMNNRDHRKILVIDGHTGFTGGINIADEYINKEERFGLWKDNAIMIRGDAVFNLTTLFLSNWRDKKDPTNLPNFEEYFPVKYISETEPIKSSGYVQPYGSYPLLHESVGENVYLNLILKAKKYVYIMTPYLILDGQLESALRLAAKNGVKVKILTPHIPDKKMVFQLTRSYYQRLIKDGVEIYEYTPGFVHAKTVIVDDIMAIVGTINFDYRSLFLHFENAAFIYKSNVIMDIKRDFDDTLLVSMQYTEEMAKKTNIFVRMFRAILRIFAPLM